MSITEALIKKESRQYDCSVVSRLKLQRKGASFPPPPPSNRPPVFLRSNQPFAPPLAGLRDITNLDSCTSLVELSLAYNDVRSRTPITLDCPLV